MTDVFAFDQSGQQRLDEEALATGISPDTVQPGFWHRAIPGTGTLFMRGGANTGRFIGMAGGALLRMGAAATPVESTGPEVTSQAERDQSGDELLDGYFRRLDSTVTNAVDYWTPRPNEVGTAGRILGGLAEAALPLMAGAGNPSLLIGTQEMGTAADLVREGVSAPAAVGVGAVQGAATAVGFRVPFLGRSLTERIGSGVAGNLAVGAGTALASRSVLNAAGETEAAKSFDPLDLEARAVDVLTGAAFGGIAHVQMRSAERAAAITAANARHFQEQTAPGAPVDLDASAAHQAAMETATRQLLSGEPVVAPRDVTEATFAPREFVAQSLKERAGAVRESLPEEAPTPENPIPAAEHLPPAERAVESRFREQIGSSIDAAMESYAKLPDSQGGKILNTDTARELSPDYLKDRTLSAAVHEPASYVVKEMYARKLAEAPGPDEDPHVIFSAGGTGAGKTTGLALLGDEVSRAQIVYDTNMNSLPGAVKKIDQALEAGKQVTVVYTYREPIDALQGALGRAMRQAKKFGSGRTVPLNEHISTHVGSRDTIEKLGTHYAGDDRVQIRVIDNSGGKPGVRLGPKGVEVGAGGPKISTLRQIPKLDEGAYNSLRERAIKTLESERAAGRISEAVSRGFLGAESALGPRGPDRAGNRGQPQPSGSGGRVDDPLTASVRERLQESDIRIPTGEIDAEGTPVTQSAREALAEADAGIVEAETMGRGVMAAVTCFLQRGA